MTSDVFLASIKQQYSNHLPFVVYRKPNDKTVKALLQKDESIHTVDNFTESGFVFAPFDDNEDAVLIPLNESNVITTNSVKLEVARTQTFSKKDLTEAKLVHINIIEKALDGIKEEKLIKVIVSRKETVEIAESNPIEIFKRLLNAYASAFVYCWYHPKVGVWLGATPEALLKIEGNRFTTMALAGTQAYDGTLDVTWQSKEIKEQQLVTNFIVENIKPSVDNLKVSETETVKAGNLLHLKTKLFGTLKASKSGLRQILNSLHPTPAICGLPKIVAKEFILKNENYNREFYTGFLGELNFKLKTSRNSNKRNVENNIYTSIKNVSNVYVNLRCMQLKDNQANIYVGGGITKDSIPENEWQETVIKTHIMKKVLQ